MGRAQRRTEAAAAEKKKRFEKLTAAKTTVAKTVAKETGKKAREKRARGSGTGDTKADRRRSGRAAAFDKEKERVKPPKTVDEPVVAETLVEDDVADLPDKVAPFTPLKKTGQVGLFSTPIVDDINFDVDIVQHPYTAHTGEERFAMNVRACGYRNESVFTLLTPPELFKQCGVVWGSSKTSDGNNRPSWNEGSKWKGFAYQLHGKKPPRSLELDSSRFKQYYDSDIERVLKMFKVRLGLGLGPPRPRPDHVTHRIISRLDKNKYNFACCLICLAPRVSRAYW